MHKMWVGWLVHAVIFILHSDGPLYEAANNPFWSNTKHQIECFC